MLKHVFAVFIILLNIAFVSAANVEVQAQIFEDQTIYTYNFHFEQNDSYRSFSFERPSDSRVDLAVDNNTEDIKYSLAGDFMIVQPKSTAGQSYKIRIASSQVSEEIKSKGSFSTYTNFNFPVDELKFELELADNVGEIENIFPRSYEIGESGQFVWNIQNVESDTLFLLEFEQTPEESPSAWELVTGNTTLLMGLIFFLIIIIVLLVYFFLLRKNTKEETKPKKKVVKKKADDGKPPEQEVNEDRYEEITRKFLTDNEREVVEVIRENQGISQYDILNHLPKMTKSNLSKIISKLNARKILNRIRVGKVNKIYLGEKLEEPKQEDKEDSSEEQ